MKQPKLPVNKTMTMKVSSLKFIINVQSSLQIKN